MDYRILRIRGRDQAARQTRLEAAQRWMASRGWKLVDYAESTRQAMFGRASDSPAAGGLPWGVPPGHWRGVVEEWSSPRRLAIPLAAVVVLAALFIFNARHDKFDAREAAANADEQWWIVTADRVHVRERPKPDAPGVAMLHKGQRVLVNKRDGNWVQIIQPERGFLSKEFLRAPRNHK
jgi:hypothetical protein